MTEKKTGLLKSLDKILDYVSPSPESTKQFMQLGLQSMDSKWFRTAIPAYMDALKSGTVNPADKRYNPWHYFIDVLNTRPQYSAKLISEYWEYIDELLHKPLELKGILEQKPENIPYLETPEGYRLLQYLCQSMYDKLYDWEYEHYWGT